MGEASPATTHPPVQHSLHALLDETPIAHQAGVQRHHEVAPVLLRELVGNRRPNQGPGQELHHQREVASLVALVKYLDGTSIEHLDSAKKEVGVTKGRARWYFS